MGQEEAASGTRSRRAIWEHEGGMVLTTSCWSLGSISLMAGLPWAGEGPAVGPAAGPAGMTHSLLSWQAR